MLIGLELPERLLLGGLEAGRHGEDLGAAGHRVPELVGRHCHLDAPLGREVGVAAAAVVVGAFIMRWNVAAAAVIMRNAAATF